MANFTGNPNHPVVKEMEHQWHKVLGAFMLKVGVTAVEITTEDIQRFVDSGLCNVAAYPNGHTLAIFLISDAEAQRIVEQEGGKPQ